MAEEVLINVENLNKTFKIDFWKPRNHVLKDITFSVKKGEVYGFLGHNGAGKTTTIKILTNLISKDSGIVELWGKPPDNIDIKKRIGFLPENPIFYDHLTGEEFLQFYAQLHNLPSSIRNKRIKELLKLVGINESAAKLKLRKYSRGMVQRVGLAQSLINEPELLILDEPLSGLDPIGRHDLREIILKESEKGKTIFFSSHLLSDVEVICDHVTILVRGRVVSSGKIKDLVSKEIESWDITVSSRNSLKELDNKKQLVLSSDSEHIVRVFKEEEIEKLVKEIYNNRGKIKSITPNKKTLEEIFIKEMQRENEK